MIQKSEQAQKGSNCLTLIRKTEVSLGNASRALVSHLGGGGAGKVALAPAQKLLPVWELICHCWKLVAFVSVSVPSIYYCQLREPFGLSQREVCVSRRDLCLVHLLCSSHLFFNGQSHKQVTWLILQT